MSNEQKIQKHEFDVKKISGGDLRIEKMLKKMNSKVSGSGRLKSKNFRYVFPTLIIFSFLVFVFSLAYGTVSVGFIDVVKALFGQGEESILIIIREIRFPRAVVAYFVGITLAGSGAMIKAVMKNPLADTGLLGIQTGATVVAMLIILVYPWMYWLLPFGAFMGGLIAYMILMLLAYNNGFNPLRVILSGVAVNALFGAIIGLITIYNADKIQGALAWLNGSLAGEITHSDMRLMFIYGSISIVVCMLLYSKCNLLLLDDSTIMSLGYNVNKLRFLVATASVFIATISVSVVGVIGFIGLVCPHIARLLVGSNHKHMIPISMLLGGSLVTFSDTLQKIIFSPLEIPVGIVIAFIGAPFFLYLMRRQIR